MLKKEELKQGQSYTMIGTNMMAVTVCQTIMFIKISEAGSIVFKRLTKSGFTKEMYSFNVKHDYQFIPGPKSKLGIFADSEIPTRNGMVMFSGDNNLNIAIYPDKIDDFKAVCEQYLSEEDRLRLCLYSIDPTTNTRSTEGDFIFQTDLMFK